MAHEPTDTTQQGIAEAAALIEDLLARIKAGDIAGIVLGLVTTSGNINSAVHIHGVSPHALIPAAAFATHEVMNLLAGEGLYNGRAMPWVTSDTKH